MKAKRVLHIVSGIYIESGVMAVIMNMYRNIDVEKIQFDFLYFDEREKTYEQEINKLGGMCYKISRPNLSIKSNKEIINFFKLNSKKYTIVHNHETYLNVLFKPIAQKYGIKNIIVHSHTTKYSDKKLSAIRNRILCMPLKIQTDYKFACSKAAAEFLYGKKSVKNNNVYVLNNAIDVGKFKYDITKRVEVRRNLKLEDNLIIGHVGRFNNQKNHRFLIEIFYEISKVRTDARLLLIGSGPLENDIKEKVKNLNLENRVIFLGRRNDISDLMQGMDVFLLPSLYEGLPVVGIEAQAAGLPCFMSTKITDEVVLCNTKQLDLCKGAKFWAGKIIEYINDFKRCDVTQILIENNFEIKNESNRLREFYLNLR